MTGTCVCGHAGHIGGRCRECGCETYIRVTYEATRPAEPVQPRGADSPVGWGDDAILHSGLPGCPCTGCRTAASPAQGGGLREAAFDLADAVLPIPGHALDMDAVNEAAGRVRRAIAAEPAREEAVAACLEALREVTRMLGDGHEAWHLINRLPDHSLGDEVDAALAKARTCGLLR